MHLLMILAATGFTLVYAARRTRETYYPWAEVPFNWVPLFLLIRLVAGAIWVVSGGAFVAFMTIRITNLVWKTSSKLARVRKTDDGHEVFVLRRKLYACTCVILVPPVAVICSMHLKNLKLISIASISGGQVIAYFLQFLKSNIDKFDDIALQSMNDSDGIPFEEGSEIRR